MYAYIQQRSSGRKRPAKSPKGALSFGETPRCTCKPFYTAYMKASRQDPRRGAASFAETPNCTCNPFLTGYMKVSSGVPSVKGDEMQWQGMTRKRCFGKKAGLCGSA